LLARWLGRMMEAGKRGKAVLGRVLIVVGSLVLSGGDKLTDGGIITVSTDCLIEASTAF